MNPLPQGVVAEPPHPRQASVAAAPAAPAAGPVGASPAALQSATQLVMPLLFLSAISNLAILISPIFMMQVLDRVVPTGNLHTLVMLLIVASVALLLQAAVDGLRDLSLQRLARWSERLALPAVLAAPIKTRSDALSDVSQVKTALMGHAAAAGLSLPWLPLFVFVLWAIHPWLAALCSALIGLSAAVRLVAQAAARADQQTLAHLKNTESAALKDAQMLAAQPGLRGFTTNVMRRFQQAITRRSAIEDQVAPIQITTQALSAFVRSATQLLGLSLGAALVVEGSLSAGGMIAASLILTKTVTSFETVLSSLPQLRAARQAFAALKVLPMASPSEGTHIAGLSGALRCAGLIFPRGSGAPPRLDRISFELAAGQCLVVVGPSGSGKTTLLEALSGVTPSPIGTVWLDDTEIQTLPDHSQTVHIGFLPQLAQLCHGTLADNICGFDPNATDEAIVAAAQMAGVHGLISALPQSYETDIGAQPYLLSAGQKQRVALARAVYHQPRYLYLDEPNALLDAAGERQLCSVLARLKRQGTTIVMIIHRSGLMGLADYVLALDHGRVADFGQRSEVLGRMSGGRRRIELPLLQESLHELVDWVLAQFSRRTDAELSQRAELIACELFNLARSYGPQDSPRSAVFLFRFVSAESCEITLTEDHPTKAAQKMQKIVQLLKQPDVQISDLPRDEAALAVITQLSDDFDIRNADAQAVYRAALSTRPVALNGMAQH